MGKSRWRPALSSMARRWRWRTWWASPVVRARDSLGACGDVAPLAHSGLVLIGEGEATLDGERLPGRAALQHAGLSPITLAAKEGLAIINETHLMAAAGVLAIHDAH